MDSFIKAGAPMEPINVGYVKARGAHLPVVVVVNEDGSSLSLGSDRELVVSTYRCKVAFSGASFGDTITATQVIDVSGSTPTTVSTIWRNQSTAADLASVPSAANLELVGSQALTDAQLRASAVPVSMAETNWATTFARNVSGQITQESRTDGSVTQSRAYTYDASGNLTGIGAWA